MQALKLFIEQIFADLARLSFDRPWYFIVTSGCLMAFFVMQLPFITVDTSTEGFFKKNDPVLLHFSQFKEQFGRDEQVVINIESPEIFTEPFLQQLRDFHLQLEADVKHVDQVDSLINVRDIRGEDDELVVAEFLEVIPKNAEALMQKQQQALNNKLYKDSYLSADAKATNVFVRPNVYYRKKDPSTGEIRHEVIGEKQTAELMQGIHKVASAYPLLNRHMHIAGMPAITDELNRYLVGDMLKFIMMAIVLIGLALFALFKRVSAVCLPLLVMVTSLLCTMGLMGLTGQPVQMPTVILPSFIMAVGVGDAIHLLSLYYRQLQLGLQPRQSLINALRHTGLPMFFTTITTAASLCSFAQSEILPVANLGIFAAAGVIFAFIFTVVLLPALLSLSAPTMSPGDASPMELQKTVKYTWFDAFLDFSVRFANSRSKSIVCCGVILMIVCFTGAMQLSFSHDPVKWLPDDSEGRLAIEYIDGRVGGTVPVEIIIDSGHEGGVKEAAFMIKLDALVQELQSYSTPHLQVARVVALSDMLKETNKALFSNADSAYQIPDSRPVIAQELLMLETSGAKDLFKLVDPDYQKVRVTVITPWVDALYFGDYVNGLQQLAEQRFDGLAEVSVTGVVAMLSRTLKKIMHATAVSYLIAFVVISLMMVMLLGSLKYGLISMIPNVLPITMAMALMQVSGAPLDMFSMLIGSIAIGLSVDDTVHFMHGFRRVYAETGDALKAVSDTLHSSGRAMLSTSIVLSAGFLIYLFSVMKNLQDFGFFTALCIVVALLADFWLAPALVLLLNKPHKQQV